MLKSSSGKTPPKKTGDEKDDKKSKLTRRAFLTGAVAGTAITASAAAVPKMFFDNDKNRPPFLYEHYVDNYWRDTIDDNEFRIGKPLKEKTKADYVVVGGGFTGLSAAFNLVTREPKKRIALLEGASCGFGASGRNGGIIMPGFLGCLHLVDEVGMKKVREVYDGTLEGLHQIRKLIATYGVDCDLEENGGLYLAMNDEELEFLSELQKFLEEMGTESKFLDKSALNKRMRNARFVGALSDDVQCILNPLKLALGMKRVVQDLGVEVFERTRVVAIEGGTKVTVRTELGEVVARKAVVAVNGYAGKLGLLTSRALPVANYIVATEPLSVAQLEAIGWSGREAAADMRTNFMYLRLSKDNRIIAGGETSPYFYNSKLSSGNYAPAVENVKRSLIETFPQLKGIRFTHAWGGTLSITRDLVPVYGSLPDYSNVYYALGYSGEGILSTQMAGKAIAQMMTGESGPLTKLPMADRRPPYVGFEPVRYPAFKIMERLI